MKFIFFKITFLFLIVNLTYAQNRQDVKNYTIEDGLSQNSVNCLFQSSDGIIWIGTQDGLNIFDGYNIHTFEFNPNDSNSISSNYINDITEGNNGDIIIATRTGITIWKRVENKFIKLENDPGVPNSLIDNNVLQVLFYNNTIWALTENYLEKHIEDQTFKHYSFNTDSIDDLNDYNTLDLIVDIDGKIWMATKSGINIFYPQTEQFYQIRGDAENISNKEIRTLYLDNNNNLWAGTYNGLNFFESTSSLFSNFFYNNKNNLIRENTITKILIDNKNTFWIGTKAGLKTFSNNKIIDFNNKKINSIDDQITALIEDNTGNIWCGTLGSGIYKFTNRKIKFCSFSDFKNPKDKQIFALYADEYDRVWTGSSGGLSIIDKNKNEIIYTNNLKFNDTLQEVTVYSMFNNDDYLWLGTDQTIFIVNKKTFEIKNIFDFFEINTFSPLINNRVNNINKDNENIYWISTTNGLIEFNQKKFKIHKYNKTSDNCISSNKVTSAYPQGDSIWITTFDGLNLYNKKTKQFKTWFQKDGLSNSYGLDIFIQSDSVIWITTNSGLTKLNHKTNKLNIFSSWNSNFINDFFYCVSNDTNNNLWLSSNYGIIKFNTESYKYTTFDKTDGLSFLECNVGGMCKDKKHNIYVSGVNGLTWANMYDTIKASKPDKVQITKLEISNTSLEKNEIFFPDVSKTYRFDYKSIINVYFYLPDFTVSEKNRYVFKIDGLTEDWSDEQKVNFINITGLSPGKYTLYIKARNSMGEWTLSPTEFTFEIIPPWEKSLSAKILYAFIGILIISSILIFTFKRFKKENKILQERNFALEQLDNQRKLIEEKNKNITDSITYAKKIIEAILPPINKLNNLLPESFIYFKPKDIVSGDFYWFTEKSDKIIIAAVDCTGHGIPGAFMSIIGMNLLDRLVNEGIYDPGIILNLMNKEVISTLKKKLDEKHIKDGMDLTLTVIDKTRKLLSFAGAYNNAYILRNNSIIQLKGDRKSVGNDFDYNTFTTQEIKLRDNDFVYLFSDGYTDQFGGINGKKYKFRRFREQLIAINELPHYEQEKKLHNTFIEWKMDYEQIDDVLVIGFKPLSYLK